MLLGMVTNPPKVMQSEYESWRVVAESTAFLLRECRKSRVPDRVLVEIESLGQLAEQMLYQLDKGFHVNGRHRVNGRGTKTSENVIAVIYRHLDDDQLYIHGFADADITPITHRDGSLTVKGLIEDTDVEMYALPDGSVRLQGKHGQRLWEDM